MNILCICLEDTSPRFGCYGDPLAKTPHLDRLAREGTIFLNTFSTSPVCAPSRSSFITGMYPTEIGTQHMRTARTSPHAPALPTPYESVPPPYVKCVTEELRHAGYYCFLNGKSDFQFKHPITQSPSSAWDVADAPWDLDKIHWRHRKNTQQPFFGFFNLERSHESGMWSKDPIQTDPNAVKLPPYLPDTQEVREALARQYDRMAENDRLVGKLLSQLEADGLADSTAVFVLSDHGEGLPRSKRWLYDTGIRVPMIVRIPGVTQAGERRERLVSLLDLAPTWLRLAGVVPPVHLSGAPFLGHWEKNREAIFASRDRFDESYDRIRCVRDERFKYIQNFYPRQSYVQWIPYSFQHAGQQALWQEPRSECQLTHESRPPEELYDLDSDPWELKNLAELPEHQETLDRLRGKLKEWEIRHDPHRWETETQMVARMWPGGKQPKTEKPLWIPIGPGERGDTPLVSGATLPATSRLLSYCATEGASILFQIDETSEWRLVGAPLSLTPGSHAIRMKSVRYGFEDSDVVEWKIEMR